MESKDKVFIVFCEEHHYNPLGVVRSLGEAGISPCVIAYGKKLRVVAASKYVKQIYHVDTIEDGYRELLNKFGSLKHKPFVITCDDRVTSYLDERYDELKNQFYFFNAGEKGRITYFMDKENINLLAEKHGLKVPKSFVVKKGEVLDDFEYPIITKAISSNSGAWKDDVFICNNKNEYLEASKKILSEIILVQKFIEKSNELCLDGFSVNSGKDVFISIASKYNYCIPGEYSFDYTSENFNDNSLKQALISMLSEIKFEGIFSIEFLIDKNGNYYFLEINFRNSTWSYTSTCLGMNLPVLWADGTEINAVPKNSYKNIPENYRSLVEYRDFTTRVRKGKMNIFKWFKDLKSVNCFMLFNKNDPHPFYRALFDKFKIWKRFF